MGHIDAELQVNLEVEIQSALRTSDRLPCIRAKPTSKPDMADFDLADSLDETMDVVKTSSACFEPFEGSHPPALLKAVEEPCKHMSGAPCLREWYLAKSENSNRCPVCRTKKFLLSNDQEDDNEEDSDEDEDRDEDVSDDRSDNSSVVSEDEEIQDVPGVDEYLKICRTAYSIALYPTSTTKSAT